MAFDVCVCVGWWGGGGGGAEAQGVGMEDGRSVWIGKD